MPNENRAIRHEPRRELEPAFSSGLVRLIRDTIPKARKVPPAPWFLTFDKTQMRRGYAIASSRTDIPEPKGQKFRSFTKGKTKTSYRLPEKRGSIFSAIMAES